jgi:hypothetical protein
MSSDGWARYEEYARRLDAVRAEETARTAGMREGVAQMSAHAEELQARLNGQGQMLSNLAVTLRLRRPKLTPLTPEQPPQDPDQAPAPLEPAPALSRVASMMDTGDREARAAATRGEYPMLLPKLSLRGRNLLVYGLAALAVLALQGRAFAQDGAKTSPISVLFLFPLIGFAVAYLVLRIGSRTRVSQEPPDLSPRLGFVLCFLIGPIGALISVALSFQSRSS